MCLPCKQVIVYFLALTRLNERGTSLFSDGGQRAMDDENDLARRQAALRSLAQSQAQQPDSVRATPQKPAPPAPSEKLAQSAPSARTAPSSTLAALVSGRPSRGGGRRGAIIGVVLLVVVVIASVAVGAHFVMGQRVTLPAPKPVVQLNPTDDNLGCINTIAWSPDGTEVAMLGNLQGDCEGGSPDSPTDAIFIYGAASGKLVEQLHPDPTIFDSPAVSHFLVDNAKPLNPAMLFLQSLAWTPDGRSLLMQFNVTVQPSESQSSQNGQSGVPPTIGGVLRLSVGRTSQATLWRDTAVYPQHLQNPNGVVERWDLTEGKAAFMAAPAPATMYRWNSDGTLTPAGSAAGKPIGAPNKGQTFSIWQSGRMQLAQAAPSPNGQPVNVPQDIQWIATFSAISPDGRYYYPYFADYGSLVPPSTKQVVSNESAIEPHDQVLVALARSLSATTLGPNQYAQTLVTWRPDGRLLATLNANTSGDIASAKFTVSIFDTQTGKLVKQLTPNFAGLQSGNAGNEQLQWSPDGSHLLLMDNVYGAITIWGPGALPQG